MLDSKRTYLTDRPKHKNIGRHRNRGFFAKTNVPGIAEHFYRNKQVHFNSSRPFIVRKSYCRANIYIRVNFTVSS